MRSARNTPLFPELHLPTGERPRHYTVRAHTYAWMDTFGGGTVPCLTVHGHWLESAGFKVGSSVSIEATVGRLAISLLDYPESTRQRHSNAFEKHIEKRGRTSAGGDVVHEHPGWLVREHILAPMGASTLDFAHAIGVSQDFAECFLAGDYDVDLDLAERLGPFCRTSQRLWLDLQRKHHSVR
ncbi:SymE family type I addiction module toxin [Stenotrophomonas sp.]|uniref:SymE family type I addiction module toxin n=1 Tax=Stenotrophomonas sp. TaxID=69392 RepID=UPI0028A8C4CE|nr:SymE family type I addiction module toxin [Stenotrophomonas sp.]